MRPKGFSPPIPFGLSLSKPCLDPPSALRQAQRERGWDEISELEWVLGPTPHSFLATKVRMS